MAANLRKKVELAQCSGLLSIALLLHAFVTFIQPRNSALKSKRRMS
jgi:hypothetical protein